MSQSNLALFKEYTALVGLNIKVKAFNFIEYLKTFFSYYGALSFAKVDSYLVFSYLWRNPFQINKRFLLEKGETDLYNYGETPLKSLELISKECHLSPRDTLFELGCGRGRTCFWLRDFVGCSVVGIDQVPEFIDRANLVKNKFQLKGLDFRKEDILKADLSSATAIYLYGSSYSNEFIQQLTKKLSLLPSGVKIISVSYPITDDKAKDGKFEVMKCFPVRYTWGEADVYLSIRK